MSNVVCTKLKAATATAALLALAHRVLPFVVVPVTCRVMQCTNNHKSGMSYARLLALTIIALQGTPTNTHGIRNTNSRKSHATVACNKLTHASYQENVPGNQRKVRLLPFVLYKQQTRELGRSQRVNRAAREL
jgi:hypothetical protein